MKSTCFQLYSDAESIKLSHDDGDDLELDPKISAGNESRKDKVKPKGKADVKEKREKRAMRSAMLSFN
jgi:hypothetical protein